MTSKHSIRNDVMILANDRFPFMHVCILLSHTVRNV